MVPAFIDHEVRNATVLRITTTTEKGAPVLKLEGRIGGPWVDELGQAWSAALGHGGAKAVMVDMRAVSYVDHRGAELLLRMEGEGTSIVNCSHFIRQLVRADGDGHETVRRNPKRAKKESNHASTLRS